MSLPDLERQTKSDGCPIQDPMLMVGLLGFCDPRHFGGGDDFYNTNYYFFPLLVSERLCGLLTWCERFCAATAYRGLQFGCALGEQREKHANSTWCMEFSMSRLFLFFSPLWCFPLGSDFILSSLSSFLTRSSLMWWRWADKLS